MIDLFILGTDGSGQKLVVAKLSVSVANSSQFSHNGFAKEELSAI